uniref:NAC domain-containing protein n=1 Tax=Kalanchoe fedtschenkoi TaxID=63787 RepID=A0A7N0U342_KALFE
MANLSSQARFTAKGGLKGIPFGFRFNPSDEEVIVHYLMPKARNCDFSVDFIGKADFNKCEPWDLPKIENMDNTERFYYCQRDRKYPNGLRTNRATMAGFWKATGRDREIYTGHVDRRERIGMRKSLVFYTGRAPRGEKTNWVMYEYRLMPQFFTSFVIPQNEWVVARIFYKNTNSGGGRGTMQSDEGGSDSVSQKADAPSTAHDRLIMNEDFESLPPLVEHSAAFLDALPPPQTNKATVDTYQQDDDVLIYAENPAQFYPTYAATLLPPDLFGCEQPTDNKCKAEPPNYPGESSQNANLAFDDTDDDMLDLPDLGSLPDLSILWD